ncbi:MAG: type IV secretion system protein [Azoarcus sp.]|jgi:type IV secretion system protein VirB8|nr:type IV secretion system protein [Azoarcus sp.]
MFKKPSRPAPRADKSAPASARTPSLTQGALDWEADRNEALERSEARAWTTARIMSALAVIALVALAMMIPFYKLFPVIFEVDKATGEVMQARTDPTGIKANELVAKNMLAAYVSRRERYHWTLLDDDYEAVFGMSDEQVARDYRAIYDGPNALDKKLGSGTDISVKILSVELSPNDPDKRGTVRWERKTRRGNQVVGNAEQFSSDISFKFAPPNVFKREKVLIANPMGFSVDGYAVASVLVAADGGRK